MELMTNAVSVVKPICDFEDINVFSEKKWRFYNKACFQAALKCEFLVFCAFCNVKTKMADIYPPFLGWIVGLSENQVLIGVVI